MVNPGSNYRHRKKNDTSIGDAINWEWIVHCAENSNAAIHIVSRDSDYGVVFDDVAFTVSAPAEVSASPTVSATFKVPFVMD